MFITAFTISSMTLLTSGGPVVPPEDPGAGGYKAVGQGGGAPIGSGIVLLLAMGAAYGGKKVYKAFQDNE